MIGSPSSGASGPAWRSTPAADYSLGDQYVELAASCGLHLDGWQAAALVDGLGVRIVDAVTQLWASFEVGLCVCRQNGKSAVLEALMLGSLFLDGGLTIYSAHEYKTAVELFRRVDQLIASNDELAELVRAGRRVTSTNELGFEIPGGARLRFLARTSGSGRGFSGDRLVFDEAMILGAGAMGAMLPTLSARPNPQVWYAGSAGKADSDHWRAVRDRGRAGSSSRLTWLEYGNDRGVDPTDRAAWSRANPAIGARLRWDVIEAEFESLGRGETLTEWLRERLGVWDDPGAVEQVIDPQAWAQLEDESSQPLGGVVELAIDVDPSRSWASIAAAGKRSDGRYHVELVDRQPGTGWLVPRLLEVAEKADVAEVWLDGASAAASLVPELEKAGLNVRVTAGRDYAAACGVLFDAAAQQQLRHLGQLELTEALAGAGRRNLGEAWAWSARSSTVDISPLVAVTVALWAHVRSLDLEHNVW